MSNNVINTFFIWYVCLYFLDNLMNDIYFSNLYNFDLLSPDMTAECGRQIGGSDKA